MESDNSTHTSNTSRKSSDVVPSGRFCTNKTLFGGKYSSGICSLCFFAAGAPVSSACQRWTITGGILHIRRYCHRALVDFQANSSVHRSSIDLSRAPADRIPACVPDNRQLNACLRFSRVYSLWTTGIQTIEGLDTFPTPPRSNDANTHPS